MPSETKPDIVLWTWKGAEQYKNDRLAYYQEQLIDRGITNTDHLKNLVAELILENGALTADRIGDHGCSLGIPQLNACVHHKMSAKKFYDTHKEWQDWQYQMRWMADSITTRYQQYNGNIFLTVLAHNSPLAASRNQDNGYWSRVLALGKVLTNE